MSVSKDTWKILDDAREHYMTIVKEFSDMDHDEQITWLSITENIEDEIKKAKSKLEAIMKPEEHKRKIVKALEQGS